MFKDDWMGTRLKVFQYIFKMYVLIYIYTYFGINLNKKINFGHH